jgi:hypothetical protein
LKFAETSRHEIGDKRVANTSAFELKSFLKNKIFVHKLTQAAAASKQ